MKNELFEYEFGRIFHLFQSEPASDQLKFELDVYKRLLNFFLLGDSFYFIINHNNLQFDHISKEVEQVLGYSQAEMSPSFLAEQLHPDDRGWFLTSGTAVYTFFSTLPVEKCMKYKVRYDLRYKKKNGEYVRLLHQGVMLEHDDVGNPVRTLSVFSNITYLKQGGNPVLSFIGIDNEPSYIDTLASNPVNNEKEDFTKREKEILRLMIEGKLSKEIGDILKISKQTVDKHRKNMVQKKHVSNTNELIGKSIINGWL